MTDALHIVLDGSALVAAGKGNALASRLIDRAHSTAGFHLYAPVCALIEADRARRGTAEHIAALPGITLLELDLSTALAMIQDDTWAWSHCRHAVQPTPDRPDGAFVATVEPDRWKGYRMIDLTP
ncbi:hypothetical protein ACIRF8_00885 [Streptomyces sp. NPDC102406]|uniref:hypothetical protein n=1 Tax=Streptomyces sp. NPDC102406 TaxID=3366171 RepID=UPI00382511CF